MARAQNRWIRGLVFVLAAVLAGMIWVNRDRFAPVEVGSKAPSYEVFNLNGDSLDLADYRGSVVLLNVWATFCGPCLKEMPALERLHNQLATKGLEVLGVSVDRAAGPEDIRGYADRLALTFPILHDRNLNLEALYAVQYLPTTFIIDRKGRIREKVVGAREWDDPAVVEKITKMLEQH